MTFTSLVNAPRALLVSAAEVFLSTDLKCSGLMPDGPAPEPLGNESAAVETSDGMKDLGGVKISGGGGCARLGAGCFCCISSKLS